MSEADDEMIAKFRDIGTDAENPAVRALSKMTAAILEQMQNLNSDQDVRETEINHIRLRATLTELEGIPPDVWERWVEADQAKLVATFRTQVEILIATKPKRS
jgi:hypothetical protein